jgi:crotonobetainyl-CoA:carnitine CoA-transferase CaiB-like acyl-CoA transferase
MYGRQGKVRERGSLQHSGWPGGAFETQDGRWIVFTAPAQHLFERLCVMIGHPDLPKDPRFASHAAREKNIGEVLELMRRWFAERPFDDAAKALLAHDVPHSPIMSMADIFADPHYRERQSIIDVPAEGLGDFPQPAVIPRLSLTPGRATHAGPKLGRHTDEILTELLEMPPEEIAALRADGVV